MKVRVRRHWRRYTPGQVTDDLPDGVANTLIDRHIADPVTVKASDAPPADRMVKRTKVHRK